MIAKSYLKDTFLMKKNFLLLVLFMLFSLPVIGHAETITYNVCESGCEFSDLYEVKDSINLLGDLSDKDIIININGNTDYNFVQFGSEDNNIKSLIINGNNHRVSQINAFANTFEIKDIEAENNISVANSKKIKIVNISASTLGIISIKDSKVSPEEVYLNDILEIDEESLNNIKIFGLAGNFKIDNMNFKNILIEHVGGILNLYHCQIDKIYSAGISPLIDGTTETNIYNSTFNSLRYLEIKSYDEYNNEFDVDLNNLNISDFSYDIYDLNLNVSGIIVYSKTTIYFDKELELKPTETIDLTKYLDYYTEDKEIDFIIEDESVAKIEGLTLTGLKEGQSNITITTDEGHVIYRIKLNVIKEIKIPLSGINIKPWVLIVGIILLGVIGFCIYLLIKTKKVSK